MLPSGTTVIKRERYVLEPSENDVLHIVQEGESLSMIAGNYYKKSQYWFLLPMLTILKRLGYPTWSIFKNSRFRQV
jgi:hypothetical protein